jgi:hypothetical protein
MGMLTSMEGISTQLIMGSRSKVSWSSYGHISDGSTSGVSPASASLYARACWR